MDNKKEGMILNKNRAFTLAETLIVISIIGFLSVVTISSTANTSKINHKKLITGSKIFYNEINLAYQNIVAFETNNINIQTLKNATSINITNDTKELRHLFGKYHDITEIDCSNLPNNPETKTYITENVQCGRSTQGYNVGFYLDRNCKLKTAYKEYYTPEDNTLKTTDNACGYIFYAPHHSEGILGKDFYIVALGKKYIK